MYCGGAIIASMILVTGGTGFIGRALVKQLVEADYDVRLLLRPSPLSPMLPQGVSVEVAVSSVNDMRALRAAMVGVDVVYHLVGGEWRGARANLFDVDIKGTQAVVQAASDVGVKRIFTVSHLGADRASAYPVLRTKGIVEENIRRSGIDYTILRSALAYGPGDHFTTALAKLFYGLPYIFLIPGRGETFIQPIWVEDLATCLVWALDDPTSHNQIYEVGGPDYYSYYHFLTLLMQKIGVRKRLVSVAPPYLRALTITLDGLFPNLPTSVYWLDYLATNRTAPLDTVPRFFNLMPARVPQKLDYLKGVDWDRALWRTIFSRKMDRTR